MATITLTPEDVEWHRKHILFGYAMAYVAGLATAVWAFSTFLL